MAVISLGDLSSDFGINHKDTITYIENLKRQKDNDMMLLTKSTLWRMLTNLVDYSQVLCHFELVNC